MKKYKDNIFAVEVPLWSTQHELYDISDYIPHLIINTFKICKFDNSDIQNIPL